MPLKIFAENEKKRCFLVDGLGRVVIKFDKAKKKESLYMKCIKCGKEIDSGDYSTVVDFAKSALVIS